MKHHISVDVIARLVIGRSQGTLSTLLNKPPQTFPTGNGKDTWNKLKVFLTDSEAQQRVIAAKRGKPTFNFCHLQSLIQAAEI